MALKDAIGDSSGIMPTTRLKSLRRERHEEI